MNKFGESEKRLGMKRNFCSLFYLCYCFNFRFCTSQLSSLFKLSEERILGTHHLSNPFNWLIQEII